jgi:acetyltransferase-like isoleucine patch superfamily enzyme
MKVLIQILIQLLFIFNIKFLRKILMNISLKIDNNSLDFSRKLMFDYLNIKIGKYSYGCEKVDGSIAKHTIIGSFCSIANGVILGGMNHPLNYVTTHPILYYKNRGFINENLSDIEKLGTKSIVIKDDVWIGQNAIVLPGVTIEKGAVIGAGAVVTKDIGPYSIAVGVPAKIIKKRFPELIIQDLLNIEWENWSDEKIRKSINSFYNVETFINNFKKKI